MNTKMLQTLFEDHRLYHDDIQIDCFIVKSHGGTLYGMYKQSLRELFKRYRGLKELYSKKELLLLDIEEAIKKTTFFIFRSLRERSIKHRRNMISLVEKKASVYDLEKNISDTEREFLRFHAQASALKVKIGKLTPEKRKSLDLEFWIFQAKYQSSKDLFLTGTVSSNVIDLIQGLPKEAKKEVTFFIQGDGGKSAIDWFCNYEFPVIDYSNDEFNKRQGCLLLDILKKEENHV